MSSPSTSPSTSPTLQEKAFDVLNRRTKLLMKEKVALLTKFLAVDLNPFSSTESGRTLKTLQMSLSKSKKGSWDQSFCATQLSTIYSAYKAHKETPGRNTRGRRPGSGIFGYFSQLVEALDQLIGEFESEKEILADREKRRQEKAAKRYSNAKVRPQDEVDWDLEKQEAEPCPGCGH